MDGRVACTLSIKIVRSRVRVCLVHVFGFNRMHHCLQKIMKRICFHLFHKPQKHSEPTQMGMEKLPPKKGTPSASTGQATLKPTLAAQSRAAARQQRVASIGGVADLSTPDACRDTGIRGGGMEGEETERWHARCTKWWTTGVMFTGEGVYIVCSRHVAG